MSSPSPGFRPSTLPSLMFTLALVLAANTSSPARDLAPGAAVPVSRAAVGSHSLCGTEIVVYDNSFFRTPYSLPPGTPIYCVAGVWVGARVDRGEGLEIGVSESAYGFEFWSEENPPPARSGAREDNLVDGIRVVSRDTFEPDFLPDHVPLGVELEHESFEVQTVGSIDWIDVKCTVRNISREFSPPGWDLQEMYFGIMMDADLGLSDATSPHSDDLGGFIPSGRSPGAAQPPGAARGPLAYIYDASGGGDDVDEQLGIVLRSGAVHSFRIFDGPAEPAGDVGRYQLMRGDSNSVPTIDADPVRDGDYRVLLTVGPVELAPGEERTYAFSLACGRLVPTAGAGAVASVPSPVRDIVVSGSEPAVTFPVDADQVSIYSVTGRRIARVTGSHWDLRTAAGARAPAGVYFYRVGDAPASGGKVVVTR